MEEIKSISSAAVWKMCRFTVGNNGKPADLFQAAGKVRIKKAGDRCSTRRGLHLVICKQFKILRITENLICMYVSAE